MSYETHTRLSAHIQCSLLAMRVSMSKAEHCGRWKQVVFIIHSQGQTCWSCKPHTAFSSKTVHNKHIVLPVYYDNRYKYSSFVFVHWLSGCKLMFMFAGLYVVLYESSSSFRPSTAAHQHRSNILWEELTWSRDTVSSEHSFRHNVPFLTLWEIAALNKTKEWKKTAVVTKL